MADEDSFFAMRVAKVVGDIYDMTCSGLRHSLSVIAPNHCLVCDRWLVTGEKFFCVDCQLGLLRPSCSELANHVIFQRLSALAPVGNIFSLLKYTKETFGNDSTHQPGNYGVMLRDAKFDEFEEVFYYLSDMLAADIMLSTPELVADVDMVVPVPMHWARFILRGFNQAEVVAERVTAHTGIPTVDALRYHGGLRSIKRMSREERLDEKNYGRFLLRDDAPDLRGKHVLLVDDIVTTGATMHQCATALCSRGAPGRISLLSLAVRLPS